MRIRFISIFLSVCIVLLALIIPINWLNGLVGNRVMDQSAYQQNPDVFQGYLIQSKMAEERRYLPIYGSSELGSYSAFHPSNFFFHNNKGLTPFLIGRGGSQTLIHFLSLSQLKDELNNRKVVIILSPQWFLPGGISEESFSGNFSLLQAYNLAFNHEISSKLKKEAIKRLLSFKIVKDNNLLATLYRGEVSNSFLDKVKAGVIMPAAFLQKCILEKKDFIQSITLKEQKRNDLNLDQIKNKSFHDLLEYADKVGRENVTNNSLNVMDSYYDLYIKKDFKKYKDAYKDASYSNSKEYSDLKLLLQFLREADAKALFISVPVNGYWYDYTGFPKERRAVYYKKVNNLITSNGFQVADYSKYEYEPYFLKDIMHLGWKGWVVVNKDLEKFYKE